MARIKLEGPDGVEYLFRVPTVKDFWIVQGEIPLPEAAVEAATSKRKRKRKPVAEVREDNVAQSVQLLEFSDQLMLRCCLRPKLLTEVVEEVPEGSVCLEEVDPMWRLEVFNKLTAAAKLEEAQEAAGP